MVSKKNKKKYPSIIIKCLLLSRALFTFLVSPVTVHVTEYPWFPDDMTGNTDMLVYISGPLESVLVSLYL